MKAAIASDHAAFELKEELKQYLKEKGYEVVDLGPSQPTTTSYAVQGHKLADYVLENKPDLAIGMCGTGLGISYALNRHEHIRAARCSSVEDVHLSRQHNDANVLVMGGRQIPLEEAKQFVEEFIKTPFEAGRHTERIEQIDKLN